MDERLLEYLAVMRDFGRIYTQRILEGSRENTESFETFAHKGPVCFPGTGQQYHD